MSTNATIHGSWASRWVFILAATGSAVGLGNIWKFPYITGEYGGGAFVLVYLICILLVGIPIMVAEVSVGRRGRHSPINAVSSVAAESKVSRRWRGIGFMGVLSGFLILSFYSVIAGWALDYIFIAASGGFRGASAEEVDAIFYNLLHDPAELMAWHTAFMALTIFVVARGVNAGLEKAVRVLMPLLFLLLVLLLGFAASSGGFGEGVRFLFAVDFSRLTAEGILVALGHSFFTLSLGMGAIMAYGAYMPQDANIGKTVLTIAFLDTLVALVAGLAIFPIVFANHLEPGAGRGLMFVTLPIAFGAMEGGVVFATLFFMLVAFAAWTSAISLAEPFVAWAVENGHSRVKASVFIGAVAWFLGIGSVLSFNLWEEHMLFGRTFFDNLDFLTTNILLPLGGMLIAIFVGWKVKDAKLRRELQMRPERLYLVWRVAIRIVSPALVALIFIYQVGWLDELLRKDTANVAAPAEMVAEPEPGTELFPASDDVLPPPHTQPMYFDAQGRPLNAPPATSSGKAGG